MNSVRAAPFLVHENSADEGVKPVAKQPRVTVSPVPEPHGIRGNTVGLVEVAKKGKTNM